MDDKKIRRLYDPATLRGALKEAGERTPSAEPPRASTLSEAITRGFLLFGLHPTVDHRSLSYLVELSVRDFLAQKFTVATVEDPGVLDLWKTIAGDDPAERASLGKVNASSAPVSGRSPLFHSRVFDIADDTASVSVWKFCDCSTPVVISFSGNRPTGRIEHACPHSGGIRVDQVSWSDVRRRREPSGDR